MNRVGRWMAVMALCGGCDAMEGGGGGLYGSAEEGRELSSLETYLVGVWSGRWGDDEVKYLVLQEDRTACEWVRRGDDYGVRHQEVQFESWVLHQTLDEDGMMLLELGGVDGEVFSQDSYEPEADRILPGGFHAMAMSWDDVLIDCAAFGTNSYAVDVERRGTAYEGEEEEADAADTGNASPEPGG